MTRISQSPNLEVMRIIAAMFRERSFVSPQNISLFTKYVLTLVTQSININEIKLCHYFMFFCHKELCYDPSNLKGLPESPNLNMRITKSEAKKMGGVKTLFQLLTVVSECELMNKFLNFPHLRMCQKESFQ
ncbi:hypothetical protein TNCV_1501071 [Trichonephila clavipes]|uniref:Uncharacterized protein n=1 Tax=Trichonephila clavipes TaxID=2585209 RepID=A0A8X6RTE9_TRICX|nr:hypothetical protein TNCV_1501071 [Trichonephila clavipes]